MMVNFMCQSDWPWGIQTLVKHYSEYICEDNSWVKSVFDFADCIKQIALSKVSGSHLAN
jgi:hypothetical protein